MVIHHITRSLKANVRAWNETYDVPYQKFKFPSTAKTAGTGTAGKITLIPEIHNA
jgi:hypothetical protein